MRWTRLENYAKLLQSSDEELQKVDVLNIDRREFLF